MTAGATRETLEQALEGVRRRLAAHAGGIELVELSADGSLRLQFTGMCTGCPFKPLTTVGTVRPALLAVKAVTSVEVLGTRISLEAEQRLKSRLGVVRGPDPQ